MKRRSAFLLIAPLAALTLPLVLIALGARCDGGGAVGGDPPPRVTLERAFRDLSDEGARADLVLLQDAPRSYAERWRMLDDAERSLDVAYFILHDDSFGLALLGRLYERALEGVRVRVLLDARGSLPLVRARGQRALLETLASAGDVDVRVYNPPHQTVGRALAELSPLLPAARSHLKVIVRDDEEGVVGGRNIAADYFASPLELPTVAYDVDVLVRSRETARALRGSFEGDFEAPYNQVIEPNGHARSPRGESLLLYARAMDAWLRGALGPLDDVADPARALEDEAARALPAPPSADSREDARPVLAEIARYRSAYGLLADDPVGERGAANVTVTSSDARVRVLYDRSRAGDAHREAWRGMLAVLRAAEREVHIESPYLVLTRDGLEVLEELSRRGVVVHLYTNGPRSSDNDLSQALFVGAWPELLARAPTVRLYVSDGQQLMHAKRVVVDGELTLIGSYNLDLLSALVNSEVMLAVWDRGFARANERLMRERRTLPHVVRYQIERDDDGAARRDAEGRVIERVGPADHTSPERLEHLSTLRELLSTFEHVTELRPALL